MNEFKTTADVQRDILIAKYGRIIEACKNLLKNSYWKDLRDYLILDMLNEIENRLQWEKDHATILRYQGEWGIAKKFYDLQKVIDLYDKDMQRLKKLPS